MLTHRRLTLLKASGGFGKTTLLAECCRRLREDGVPTAWVLLDEQDEPAVLDIYIALACQCAGLDLLDVADPEGAGGGSESRTGLVVREIQRLGKPFVIAFDEVERLQNPASVALLEFLLQRWAAKSAPGDGVPAGSGRPERRRRGAGRSGAGRWDGRTAVFQSGCGQVLRSGSVAR